MISSRRRIYGDDHEVFRDSVRRFIASEVVPHLDEWRQADGVPRSIVSAAGEAGFLGTAVPEEFGGGGADDFGFLVVLTEETVAAGATGLALLFALQAGVAIPFLLEHGSSAHKQQWLPGLTTGELIAVPAPATLSGVAAARMADALLVHNDGDGVVLTTLDRPGVVVTPITENLAGRDAGLADVTLGNVGTNTDLIYPTTFCRDLDLWFAVLALASARTAMALAVDYVRARKVFGQPLAEFENTRFRLAELWAELASLTAFVDSCVQERSAGSLEAADAAAARLTASRVCGQAVDRSLQLHGGYGYMREYPISHAFADARFLQVIAAAYSNPRETLASTVALDALSQQ
ncbi:acyl-CoA dehydrogenase [Mycobacterium lentiflavum]|uniref:Acyl-CoA dehydrogenase n=1 Tax=Mycobacterium lentiflavum TaxID=141349 RepID=A0A0E4CPF0_MYCLN|nr:acyl-CoA dehydrogenase family protein [Mycobacterium lentiflavum]CQD17850.1 acyl-CoA dehydrogenase [Mycobacterium lentiflavum]